MDRAHHRAFSSHVMPLHLKKDINLVKGARDQKGARKHWPELGPTTYVLQYSSCYSGKPKLSVLPGASTSALYGTARGSFARF